MSTEKQLITNAVGNELPLHVQNMLWYILEHEKEYHEELHSFELDITVNEDGKPMQKIVHTYEIQAYQKEHLYSDQTPVKTNVAIKVDGSGVQIMMLADELVSKHVNH